MVCPKLPGSAYDMGFGLLRGEVIFKEISTDGITIAKITSGSREKTNEATPALECPILALSTDFQNSRFSNHRYAN